MDLRQSILSETLRLFSLKGYLSTSISDILTATGASKGGLYNHFKSKEELFHAVLAEAKKTWQDKNLAGLDQVEKPLAKVRKILTNYRDLYLKDSESLPGGCIFVTFSVELDDQLPHLAREVTTGFDRLQSMVGRLLEQAKLTGELPQDVDAKAASETIFAGMLGTTVLYGADKDPTKVDRIINSLLDYLDRLTLGPAPARAHID